ncbi:MAG: Ig-like domain-containing protein, partial [Planctomycetota bacterium]
MNPARLLSLAALSALVGCSGGNSSIGGIKTGGEFLVLQTEPSDNGSLFLNDAVQIDFSNPVDLGSVDLTTFSFQVLDQIGNTVAEPVAGNFALAASPGDATSGRRLQFIPRLPTNDLFTNGGFRPGRTYIVQLVGGNRLNGTVIRDAGGRALAQPVSFRFSTSDGTTAGQLFRNTASGGPRRTGFEITPAPDSTGVVLNKQGAPALEIRLVFDQPLSPSSTNVPVSLDTNPLVRNSNARGRIFLEYADPELGPNTWIPADVELESNTVTGATVLLRPVGVLPNNATIKVVVEKTLEDISGESNQANPAYDAVFGTFRTKRAYEQQFDALVDSFSSSSLIDLAAAFSEPVAEVGPGYIKAGFAFEGTETGVEFDPVVPETILNTNFTQVVPKTGSAYNVSGGVFNFKNVTIGSGKTVRGQGNNPMVWLVSGTFDVAGTLSVRAGDGTIVDAAGSANLPKPGGVGTCGGGDGGAGSPSATQRDSFGGAGNGPSQVSGAGGGGGALACTAGCTRGSGGGGGSMSTQGDPNYKQKTLAAGSQPAPATNPFPIFQQQVGT